LRFAQRLYHCAFDPLDKAVHLLGLGTGDTGQLNGPGAEQELVEQGFVIAIGRPRPLDVAAACAQQSAPGLNLPNPFSRYFGEHGEACSGVLATLRVVRGGSEHGMRPALGPLGIGSVKCAQADTEMVAMTAYLVQRDEAVKAIVCSVLQSLGHNRTTV